MVDIAVIRDRLGSVCRMIMLALLVAGIPGSLLQASDPELVQIVDQLAEATRKEESYVGPTQSDLLKAIASFQVELNKFEGFVKSQPAWRKFLGWDECRGLRYDSFPDSNAFTSVALRWYHASKAINDDRFLAVHNKALEVERVYLQKKNGENVQSRTARGLELQELLRSFVSNPTNELRDLILTKCAECKRSGQFVSLIESLESKLVLPNWIVRIPSQWVIEQSRRPLAEPFTTSGVFDGIQTSSSGSLNGTLGLRPFATADGIGLSLAMQGEVVTRSSGQSSQVSLRSTARTNIQATKQIVFRGWGVVATEPAQVSGRTSIQYDQVVPRVGRLGRQAVINAVNSNRAKAERQAQQETESSVRKRLDGFTSLPEFVSLNSDIFSIRDYLFRLDRTKIDLKSQTTETEIDLSITCLHDDFRGAPSAPPEVFARTEFTVAVHETLLGRLLAAKYVGKSVSLSGLLQGGESFFVDSSPNEQSGGGADRVTFAKALPIDVQLYDSAIRIQANFDRVSTDGKSLDRVRIERSFAASLDGNRLRLEPEGEVKAVPIGFDSRADRISPRKRASFRAIERRVEESTKSDSALMLDLQFQPKGENETLRQVTQPKEVVISDGWLQIRYGK